MKLEPHLPQLPSIGDLLEHPRVKGVVQRINRSTLAQRATGFLDELRTSLASKSAGEAPSLAHLAERLARRLLGEPEAAVAVINATGVVLGAPGLAPPLAERSLHALFQTTAEYRRDVDHVRQELERDLAELLGGEAVLATGSVESALWLVLAAAEGHEALVYGATTEVEPGDLDWQRLAAQSGAILRASPARVGGDPAVVPASRPDQGVVLRAPGAEGTVSLETLADTARDRDLGVVDVAPAAGAIDPAAYGYQAVETVAQRLAAGADAVVIDGAGLLGGPACGLIIGARTLVDAARDQPLASLVAIDPLAVAALGAVVQLQRDEADSAIFQLPVWQLLSAPLDNLRQRAQRLAPQMSESTALAAAEAQPVESIWRRQGAQQWRRPSWVISLTPHDGDLARLRTELARAAYPIIARHEPGSVAIDMRSVFPRWDQQLVAAVAAL